MAWKFALRFVLVLGLSSIGFSSYSAQIIYGLKNASHFKSKSSHDFYVQVGSFKSKSNALRVKAHLQKKSSQPVFLKKKKGYYVVMMGPFHSASAVRAAAFGFRTDSTKKKHSKQKMQKQVA